jgi:hypothetical protein
MNDGRILCDAESLPDEMTAPANFFIRPAGGPRWGNDPAFGAEGANPTAFAKTVDVFSFHIVVKKAAKESIACAKWAVGYRGLSV